MCNCHQQQEQLYLNEANSLTTGWLLTTQTGCQPSVANKDEPTRRRESRICLSSFLHPQSVSAAVDQSVGLLGLSPSVGTTATDDAAVPVLQKFVSRPIFHPGALCWVNLNNLALRHSPALNRSDKHVKPAASLPPSLSQSSSSSAPRTQGYNIQRWKSFPAATG